MEDSQPVQPQTTAPPKRAKGEISGGCAAFFFGIFFLAGLGFMSIFIYQAYKDYRIHFVYQQTTCTVTGKRVITSTSSDGNTYRPEIDFNFQADGRFYNVKGYDGWSMSSSGRSGKQKAIAPFKIGQTYPVWYDPDDPAKAVVKKHISWAYLFALIPLIFMGIGFFGVVWSYKKKGKSKEASAFAGRKSGDDAADVSSEHVPEIKTEGGSTLDVRLGRQTSDFMKVFGLLFFSVFWNGIISVFLYQVVKSWNKGNFQWFLAIFMIPFVLVGIGVVVATIYQFLVAIGVGETIVEISNARLAPGEKFELYLSQAGNMQVNELKAELVCEERATYQVGTRTSTATEKVVEIPLAKAEHITISRAQPFELRESGVIPADAMHSFKATRNEIHWWIAVKGDIARWPDFDRKFPILIEARAPSPQKEGGA